MKRFFSICLVAALTLGFVACEEPEKGGEGNKPNNEQNGGNNGGENNGGNNNGGTTDSAYACLNGTDYYPSIMDGETYKQIESKVVSDLRVNDTDTWLWIWDETYVAGTCSGPNYFGNVDEWVSLTVGNIGWSGCGFCSYSKDKLDKLVAVTASPQDYVLHLAMKSQQYNEHTIIMYGVADGSRDPQTGNINTTKGEIPLTDAYDFPRDGEWHEIEIPMTAFTNKGVLFDGSIWATADPATKKDGHNVIAILSGTYGSLDIDACFIYKPAK